MKRTANAVWRGGIKDGKGQLSTQSGALESVPYSFATRFENEKGTNPEELIASAHAGCFSMALSMMLGMEGFNPEEIKTDAIVSLDKAESGWAITAVHLNVSALIPKIDQARFEEIAKKAKEGCPVSRVLNAKITMDAKLSSQSAAA